MPDHDHEEELVEESDGSSAAEPARPSSASPVAGLGALRDRFGRGPQAFDDPHPSGGAASPGEDSSPEHPEPAPGPSGSPSAPAASGDSESDTASEPLESAAPAVPAAPRGARARPRPSAFASAGSVPAEPALADLDRPARARQPRRLPAASLLSRAGAHAVDRLLPVPVLGLVFLLSEAAWVRSGGRYSVPLEFFLAGWVFGGWLVACLGDGWRGRSPGRRLARVRLVDAAGVPVTPLRALAHRAVFDLVLFLVVAVALWLTLWRQGLVLGDGASPFTVGDFVVWLLFAANLAALFLLLRLLDPASRFVHDRLVGLRVVPRGVERLPPVPAEPIDARPAARPRLRVRRSQGRVPDFLQDEDDVPLEPPPRPSVVRDRAPDPDLDRPAGVDHRSGFLFRLSERLVDAVGYRDPGAESSEALRPGALARVVLAPAHFAYRCARRLGLRADAD